MIIKKRATLNILYVSTIQQTKIRHHPSLRYYFLPYQEQQLPHATHLNDVSAQIRLNDLTADTKMKHESCNQCYFTCKMN